MMLLLREVYKLSLRSLQGFVQSIFFIMGLNFPVPSTIYPLHSTILQNHDDLQTTYITASGT